jgi:hypothetical protein
MNPVLHILGGIPSDYLPAYNRVVTLRGTNSKTVKTWIKQRGATVISHVRYVETCQLVSKDLEIQFRTSRETAPSIYNAQPNQCFLVALRQSGGVLKYFWIWEEEEEE